MKKLKNTRSLSLSAESIRVLDARSLELVNGGAQATSTTCNNCPPGALANPVTNDCKTWNCKP